MRVKGVSGGRAREAEAEEAGMGVVLGVKSREGIDRREWRGECGDGGCSYRAGRMGR